MKNLLKVLAANFLKFSSAHQNLLNFFFRNFKYNATTAELIIRNNRKVFIKICDQFPSAINNGFRHIDRALYIAKNLNLHDTNVIIDVGAADGEITLLLSLAYPKSFIYAFEPLKFTFAKLCNNVKDNPHVLPINKALGNVNEERTIHITESTRSSSILDIRNEINDKYLSEQLKYIADETITVSRLDDELPKEIEVNIIKIDVQGYELEVLKGAEITLQRTKIVVLEMQNHDNYLNAPYYFILDEYLRNSGFQLYDIIPSIRENIRLYEWDGIYVNTKI